MSTLEVYEWDAPDGFIVLMTGQRVWVQRGEDVHGFMTPDGTVQFVDVDIEAQG